MNRGAVMRRCAGTDLRRKSYARTALVPAQTRGAYHIFFANFRQPFSAISAGRGLVTHSYGDALPIATGFVLMIGSPDQHHFGDVHSVKCNNNIRRAICS